jgi:protein kinase-like protein
MTEGDRWIELSAGDQFAGYRIEQRLGRGGMGVLYLALEPGLERRVALKLIAPEAAAEEVFARRFAEESRIAASIEHPNVVPIYAAGEEGGVPFIAMRYVSGSDLGKRLAREGRLEPAVAADLIAQVGNGLDAIHAAGLVHRDVKPANVLLSGGKGSEHAYITDFGVARNVATNSGLTQTGRFVGTLDYVAPEQISGGEIDARADVYALGCLLFKLLTGEVPYPRDGEAARLYAHLNDPPPAPSLYVGEVPMALDDVVIRAMSKSPEDRYPSAGDLGRAAQAALRGEQAELPERTVATGAAATRTAETLLPPGPGETKATEPLDGKPSTARPETAATRRVAGAPPPDGSRGRRRLVVGAALGVVAVAAVAALVLGGSGGGDGTGTSAATGPGKTKSTAGGGQKPDKPKPELRPEASSAAALIAAGDAICSQSQATFKALAPRFPSGEQEPDPAYSSELVGISTRAVSEFDELTPPPGLAKAYEAYVKSQERVKKLDEQALKAAEKGKTKQYLKAREKRNDTQGERHELAQAVGFEVCSANPG